MDRQTDRHKHTNTHRQTLSPQNLRVFNSKEEDGEGKGEGEGEEEGGGETTQAWEIWPPVSHLDRLLDDFHRVLVWGVAGLPRSVGACGHKPNLHCGGLILLGSGCDDSGRSLDVLAGAQEGCRHAELPVQAA
jgi:hypothetical protein